MHPLRRPAVVTLALLATLGCASVGVTDRERYEGEALPRPGRILVYDFAVVPDDIPKWSEARYRYVAPETPPSAEEIETGRELGARVAQELVDEIQEMGLPAVRAAGQPGPDVDDLVLVGYFGTVDEGSALKRVVVGFGSGAPQLTTHIEAYRQTEDDLVKLGSGATASGKGRMPGVVVPAIVTVATANPIGLAVGGAVKAGEELTGRSTIEGTAKQTAQKIAEELKGAFERQGWI